MFYGTLFLIFGTVTGKVGPKYDYNFNHFTIEVNKHELSKLSAKTEKMDNIEFKGHYEFLNDLGFRESSNNYKVVNKWGYMGRYQFGMKTLKALDIHTTKSEFLNNPLLQEEAMELLLKDNKRILNKLINQYEGKVLHGVKVTESGILAAAHLGGAGNVKKWFRRGTQFKDAKGTSITSYMKRFEGYTLNI
jgi:hypothetical protein